MEAHYLDKHAVVDPRTTTHESFECKWCGAFVRTKAKLGEHRRTECKAWRPREKREGEDATGWLPIEMPTVEAEPGRWYAYTDGSGPSTVATWRGMENEGAGWGVGIFGANQAEVVHTEQVEEPIFELSGPVITKKEYHLFMGAEEATNNTGELTAMIEAKNRADGRSPGTEGYSHNGKI